MTEPAFLVLLALLAGLLLELVLGRVLTRRAKGRLAFAACLVAFVCSLLLLPGINRGEAFAGQLALSHDAVSHGALSLDYRIDGLSLVFILMATGIGAAILLYSIRYMEHEEAGHTRFFSLMLLFIAGLVGLVSAANLLLAYICWEIIGLCSYFLVGFWYRQAAAANGARKVLVMTHLAGYGFLAAVLLICARTGSLLWTDPAVATAFSSGIFALMLISAMAKSVIFPLHTWIPEAMNAPTPVSALLHSACYVKAGIYLIARLCSFTTWTIPWHTVVTALGCVTMLVGALFALKQTDLKRLLAYSTISQLGYIVTALGLGTPFALAAALFYTIGHGLFKGTLFLCAGAIQHTAGTRDMRELGGLARVMPWTSRIWLIAAAAIVGVPLTNGFIAKWLVFDAALNAGSLPVVVIAWLVSVATAFYILKATVTIFYGDLPAAVEARRPHEAPLEMRGGMGFLAALCLVFGIAPQLLLTPLVRPAVQAMGVNWQLATSWLGFQTAAGTLAVSGGAAVALVAALAGGVLYALARRPAATGKGVLVFTGGDPLPVDDAVGAVDFAEMAETAFAPAYAVTDPDPLYFTAWRGVAWAGELAANALSALERRPLLACAALAVVTILIVVVSHA